MNMTAGRGVVVISHTVRGSYENRPTVATSSPESAGVERLMSLDTTSARGLVAVIATNGGGVGGLRLGSGTVRVGPGEGVHAVVLVAEALTSLPREFIGCTKTICSPSSLAAPPRPRLRRAVRACLWTCLCLCIWACTLASNPFTSAAPLAYGPQGRYGYGRKAYGASCPGGGIEYGNAWKGPDRGAPYVYGGRGTPGG